jgi:hypothetical protein
VSFGTKPEGCDGDRAGQCAGSETAGAMQTGIAKPTLVRHKDTFQRVIEHNPSIIQSVHRALVFAGAVNGAGGRNRFLRIVGEVMGKKKSSDS